MQGPYTLQLVTFKAIHNIAPPYLSNRIHVVTLPPVPSDLHLFTLLLRSSAAEGASTLVPPDIRNTDTFSLYF